MSVKMKPSTGPITTLLGDNSTLWSDSFGRNGRQKKNLFIRGFLFVLPVLFFGALTFMEWSERMQQTSSTCAVSSDDYFSAVTSCQVSDTYFLPGSVRNFNQTHQSTDFEQEIFIESWIKISEGLITYFKYFKYTVIVFALCCVVSFIGSSIWDCLEDNIVEKYTFEFKQKVLTSRLDDQTNKAKDQRIRTMNMFVHFFETFHHSSSYFYKYITVSVVNLALHIAIFLFYAWLLFDNLSDILDPTKYLHLITLCLTDDLKQLRLDNIAVQFPALYACQTKFTGRSGTLETINVTCSSYSNQRSAIYHVCALFFSLAMIFLYIGDTMMVLYTMGFFEYAKSGGSKKKMKKFRYMTFGKRMLFLMFENNTDTLFWNDFVINLTEEFNTNEQNNTTNKESETFSANEEKKRTLKMI